MTEEAVLWQTQTLDLENGTVCFAIVVVVGCFFFCLAPVDHVSSEIEKRKTARAQFPKRKKENQFHSEKKKDPEKSVASLAPQ